MRGRQSRSERALAFLDRLVEWIVVTSHPLRRHTSLIIISSVSLAARRCVPGTLSDLAMMMSSTCRSACLQKISCRWLPRAVTWYIAPGTCNRGSWGICRIPLLTHSILTLGGVRFASDISWRNARKRNSANLTPRPDKRASRASIHTHVIKQVRMPITYADALNRCSRFDV